VVDRVVAARRLLRELVASEQLEVRRVDAVAKDLAALVDELGRTPSAGELEDWLGDHAMVDEVYAGETVLEELIARHLAPPPPDEASLPDVRHPGLEAAIAASPDAVGGYSVYADWLQEQGDPYGELIALAIAGNSERFERHLTSHAARFYGGIDKQLLRRVELDWRHGVIRAISETVVHGMLGPHEWAQLLQLRAAAFVQAIALTQPCRDELDDAIASHAAPTLHDLAIYLGDAKVPERLLRRSLRSLAVTGRRVTLPLADLPPSLACLDLRCDELGNEAPLALAVGELRANLTAPIAAQLASAHVPNLERLVLRRPGAAIPALAAPALVRLELRDGTLAREAWQQLAARPLAHQLTSLALVDLGLTDDFVPALVAHRDAFASLAELDVSGNELTRDGLAALSVFPVKSTRQYRVGNATERRIRAFAGSRIVAAEGIADPAAWREAGIDGELRWARYSGTEDYELYVSADLSRYACTCPSSIQPCKHVVALALVAERTPLRAAPARELVGRVDRVSGASRAAAFYDAAQE
jgi:uncharacterized protein (TIGR02996 family)